MTNRDYVNTWSNEKLARAIGSTREICEEMRGCDRNLDCVQCCLKWLGEERLEEPTQNRWIPCSEMLPKPNECVNAAYNYYLIQDEFGDMYVARYTTNKGWIIRDSYLALGNTQVVAWQPLPEKYKEKEE